MTTTTKATVIENTELGDLRIEVHTTENYNVENLVEDRAQALIESIRMEFIRKSVARYYDDLQDVSFYSGPL
jgi:hypothetical protein